MNSLEDCVKGDGGSASNAQSCAFSENLDGHISVYVDRHFNYNPDLNPREIMFDNPRARTQLHQVTWETTLGSHKFQH